MKTNDVLAIGNTLMDFLIEVDENFLVEMNLNKGEGKLVEEAEAKQILEKLKHHENTVEIVPGGSAANLLRAMGLLGANVILVGKVGDDEHGKMYEEQVRNHNVQTRMNNNGNTTGHAITFITPDAERSFSVHLGCAIELKPEDVLEEDIKNSKVLHLEGYQLEGPTYDIVMYAASLAKKHGTKISIDLSDGRVIRNNKELVTNFLREYVDIVFANELEARDFTGMPDEVSAAEIGKLVDIAIIKVGALGSFIHHNNQTIKVDSFNSTPIDTTGAGDTYAAGVLYGYCNNWSLEKSGKLGALLAARIIEKKGVKFNEQEILEAKQSITNSESHPESHL
jgi:sugar/nucleoside kinase (ribokinase family)